MNYQQPETVLMILTTHKAAMLTLVPKTIKLIEMMSTIDLGLPLRLEF